MPRKREDTQGAKPRLRYELGDEHRPGTTRIAETAVPYLVDEPNELASHGTTRLSSKNQITLPVHMVRELGLKPGDELELLLDGNTIQVERRPQTPAEWVARYRGSMNVPGWETKERIDAYVRGERDSWARENGDS